MDRTSSHLSTSDMMNSNDSDDDEIVGGDGYTCQQLFSRRLTSCFAYTYDDLIILPGHIVSNPRK